MENNIENKIKEAFKHREIKPSENAWKLLSAQLEVKSAKKDKLNFLKYAAVFTGLFFGLTLFFNKNTNQSAIVKEELKMNVDTLKKKPTKKSTYNQNTANLTTIKPKIKQVKLNAEKVLVNTNFKTKQHRKLVVTKEVIQSKSLAINTEKSFENRLVSEVNNSKDSEKINNEILVPVTKTSLKKKPKKKLFSTDQEIDMLLATALNKTKNNSVKEIEINVSNLQHTVETEINTSVGTKIARTFRTGLNTIEEHIASNN